MDAPELFFRRSRTPEPALERMVKLGRLAHDGTRVQANASKHKAMTHERMGGTQKRLQDEENLLLAREQTHAAEDRKFGRERTGNQLQSELERRDIQQD